MCLLYCLPSALDQTQSFEGEENCILLSLRHLDQLAIGSRSVFVYGPNFQAAHVALPIWKSNIIICGKDFHLTDLDQQKTTQSGPSQCCYHAVWTEGEHLPLRNSAGCITQSISGCRISLIKMPVDSIWHKPPTKQIQSQKAQLG